MAKENKKNKGQYGYRIYRRKIQMMKVLTGIALILIQLAIRTFSDDFTFRAVFTVSAILTVLPVANWCSPLLASWKIKTPSEAFHQKGAGYETDMAVLYDLIITSRDAIMPMDMMAIHPTGVFAYCTASRLDTKKAEKFFKEMFTTHKLFQSVKIFTDEAAYFRRLESLKPASEYEDDGSVDYTCNLLKNLSM